MLWAWTNVETNGHKTEATHLVAAKGKDDYRQHGERGKIHQILFNLLPTLKINYMDDALHLISLLSKSPHNWSSSTIWQQKKELKQYPLVVAQKKASHIHEEGEPDYTETRNVAVGGIGCLQN